MSADRTSMFGVDPRSLAAFRIGLGLLVLADAWLRTFDLMPMYTDHGIAHRADVVVQYWFLHEHAFSLHTAAGSVPWIALLFALQYLAGAALVLGWHARKAAAVGFFLVSGAQLRNLYIGEGYDALIRMFLLWSIFAPTATVWSVDARNRQGPAPAVLRDVGSLAVAVQILLVYAGTGWAKYQVDVWRTGEALWLHLQSDFFVTRFGRYLGGYPSVCRALTLTTLWAELLWPVVLVVPVKVGPVRSAGLLGLMALTFGFWLGLDVDLFPAAGAVGLAVWLPAWFWDRIGVDAVAQRIGERLSAAGTALPGGEAPLGPRGSGFAQVVATGLLLLVVVWNVGVARDRSYPGPRFGGEVIRGLFLQQGWHMFGRPATRSGWVAIEGRTVGGNPVDLMRAGGRVPRVAASSAIAPGDGGVPELPSAIYAGNRWRTLLKRIAYREIDGAALAYSRYLCREWNSEHDGGEQLDTFEIVFFHRPVPAEPGATYEREQVWEHGCFR